MTYYLKYRPQKLSELDMESVREGLIKIVRSKNIPHAFLFSGPKGTGKTSAARIVAKVLNCESESKSLRGKDLVEPCNKCKQCTSITKGDNIDVIEIDAASHRGIDDIRNLREAVKLSTAIAKKKVYIIDEAHMLTTEASNALLKTLEEPPEHVVFILATTNPEKLIETIRSRAVNIKFGKATINEVVRSLNKVVKGESLKIDNESLELIAKTADGSFRDATKILEQLVAEHKKLTKKNIEEFLVGSESEGIGLLIAKLVEKDTRGALEAVEKIHESGGLMKDLLFSLLESLRNALLSNVGFKEFDDLKGLEGLEKDELIVLINLFTEANANLSDSAIEQIPVELAVIDWCGSGDDRTNPNIRVDTPIDNGLQKADSKQKSKVEGREPNNTNGKSEKVKKIVKKVDVSVSNKFSEITDEVWTQIVKQVGPENTSTEALLRAAKPINYDGETLTLGVYYSFHKERLESHQHRTLLEGIVAEVVGCPVRIECILTEQEKKKQEEVKEEVILTEDKDDDIVKIAEEVFGS